MFLNVVVSQNLNVNIEFTKTDKGVWESSKARVIAFMAMIYNKNAS